MKKALLRRAVRIGFENYLPRERPGGRKRMDVDKKRVIDTVELDSFSHRRIDHARVSQHGSSMAANLVDAVEFPYLDRLRCQYEWPTSQNESTAQSIDHRL